ncbi:MAG: type II CAAX prenyl endopeptidase Rce1 family protein [Candidatus Hodarchaeota archaeon]
MPASITVLAIINAAIMLFLYGGLGLIGVILSKKLGFPDIWDSKVSNKQRLQTPALIGMGIGLFFILVDLLFSRFHDLGPLPHPPFPSSLVASVIAAIGEEIIFRLFFISFWVWLISSVILKKKFQSQVFWIITFCSALAFAVGHIPSIMVLFGFSSFSEVPILLPAEIILLNGVLSVYAASYFRKFGFLAAVSIHFWADMIWHVIYGIL